MPTIDQVCRFLERFAPLELAEEWDNVGLLVGDRQWDAARIMTCLTVTPASAVEAVQRGAQLIVTHHPLPFRSLKRITSETTPGRLLLQLIGARLAVYSPHTSFDSAQHGINQRLAEGMALEGIQPLVPREEGGGAGRFGTLPQVTTLETAAEGVKQFLGIDRVRVVGDLEAEVRSVAVACGSAGEFLAPAREAGCDMLITGETSFHTCLEAEATGVGLILTGHYASERFAVEALANVLAREFEDCDVWASRQEQDPLRWV